MESLNIYIISTFIGAVIYLTLAFFVYFRSAQKTEEVKRFIAFCFVYSIYTAALMLQFIMFNRYSGTVYPPRKVLYFIHISTITGGFLPLIYADFMLSIAKRRPRWYWIFYLVEALIIPFLIRHERSSRLFACETHYYPEPLKAAFPIILFIFAIITWSVISLKLARRDVESPVQRKMLRDLFFGSFFAVPAVVTDILFMVQNKGIFPFSVPIVVGYAIYFSYAIVKYRFLGIRLAIRRGIIYIVLTVFLTAFFLIAGWVLLYFASGMVSIPLIILVAFFAAVVLYPVRERLEVFVDRILFRRGYQYDRSLEQFERDVLSEIKPEMLVEKWINWLEEYLKIEHVNVFLPETHINGEKQNFTVVRESERDKYEPISEDSLLIRCLSEKQDTIFRADLPILPRFQKLYKDLDKEFQNISAEVCVPLVLADRLLFSIDLKFQSDLDNGNISEPLRQKFEKNEVSLSHNAKILIQEKDREWLITDENNLNTYTIRRRTDEVGIYTGKKLSGIIVCGNKKRGKFEEEDRRLLNSAAVRIALAIERIQLIIDLESAERFKWDLVQQLSHDLKSPLTPIKIIVNALGRKIDGDAEDQRAISTVMGEVERLQSIISHLDFIAEMNAESNYLPTKQELFDLGSLMTEVVNLFEWQAKESGITLSCQIPSDIEAVHGDAERIKRALINLINNSIKYTLHGGKVDVTAVQTNGTVTVSVTDNGIGIPESDISLIFKPFYRSDNAQTMGKGGIGLGMTIVKRIIDEHGGKIDIQSKLDIGTSIHLTIPCEPKDV